MANKEISYNHKAIIQKKGRQSAPQASYRLQLTHSPWPLSQCYVAEQRNRTKGKLAASSHPTPRTVMKYLLPQYICLIAWREGIAHHDKGQDFLLQING